MTDNIFVRRPSLGDYVCKRVSDRKVFYLDWSNPDCPEGNTFTVGGVEYEKIGTAVPYGNGQVICAWRDSDSRTWSERYEYVLTGYVLDGAEHTATFSIRTADNSWASNVDYDFTYQASDLDELVAKLNDFFATESVFTGDNQDWVARLEDGKVIINHKYADYRQSSYNKGLNGFTLTGALLPEIPPLAKMRRRNGYVGGEGAINSWYRALAYSRQDISSTTYNPNADVTSIKRSYPICLPGYLGTSSYQSDHCAFLRSVYGEGEEGWLRFMESCLPVDNDRFSSMGFDWETVKRNSTIMALKTYTSQAKTDEPTHKAARYCYDVESVTVDKGEFALVPIPFFRAIMRHIQYPAPTNSRSADAINASRLKAVWPAIPNTQYSWTGVRSGETNVWIYYGNSGVFDYAQFYGSYVALPVALYTL